jgi:hypothetical protein
MSGDRQREGYPFGLAQSFSPNLARDGRQTCPAARTELELAGRQTCRSTHAKLGLKDWANVPKFGTPLLTPFLGVLTIDQILKCQK